MADRFMNLESQLGTLENAVEHTLRTLIGAVQGHRLFADPARVLDQLQLINQLISLVLPLPAKRIGIRPLLNLAAGKSVGHVTGAGSVLRLVDIRPFRGE